MMKTNEVAEICGETEDYYAIYRGTKYSEKTW